MEQLPLGVRWRDQSVFDSFFPGPNGLVLEALRGLNRRSQGQPAPVDLGTGSERQEPSAAGSLRGDRRIGRAGRLSCR